MSNCYNHRVRTVNAYIGLIILFPSFFGYLSIGVSQMIFISMCCGVGLYVLFSNTKKTYPSPLRKVMVMMILQLICYSLTILTNSIASFGHITVQDTTDLMRPMIYLLYFSIPVLLRYDSISCIKIIFIGIAIGVLFDFIKFIPSFYPIIRLYTHLDPNGLNYARFNGTFTYCYSFGFIVLFLLAYSLNASYKYRFPSIILIFAVIFLTGSRSIILGAFILIFLQILFFGGSGINKISSLLIIGFIITLFYYIVSSLDIPMVQNILKILERGYDSISGEATDASFNTRNDQIERAMHNFYLNPLFGVGPQKGEQEPIENLMGYYISSWGLGGSLCYLTIWCFFSYNSFKCAFIQNDAIKTFSRANLLWLLLVPIGGMSAPITEGIRLAPLYYVIQGIQGVFYYKEVYLKIRLERKSKLKPIYND